MKSHFTGKLAAAGAKSRVCVVSNQATPSPTIVRGISRGIKSNDWWWIFAGLDRKISKSLSSEVNVIRAGEVGLLAGRHKALEICNEDVLIYLDDDVTLPAGWLEKITAPFEDPDIHFVGCRYLPDYERAPPDWMASLWQHREDGLRTLGQLSLLDGDELSKRFHQCWFGGYALRCVARPQSSSVAFTPMDIHGSCGVTVETVRAALL